MWNGRKSKGYPDPVDFGHKLFIYRKGSCTPPHAHNHLVSAHLILKGEMRVRTFDRVQDLKTSMLIKPTLDRIAGKGTCVTMSDAQDNIHWFEGMSDLSVSFDIPLPGIQPTKQYGIPEQAMNQIFLDPRGKTDTKGLIEAHVIAFEESLRRFASPGSL